LIISNKVEVGIVVTVLIRERNEDDTTRRIVLQVKFVRNSGDFLEVAASIGADALVQVAALDVLANDDLDQLSSGINILEVVTKTDFSASVFVDSDDGFTSVGRRIVHWGDNNGNGVDRAGYSFSVVGNEGEVGKRGITNASSVGGRNVVQASTRSDGSQEHAAGQRGGHCGVGVESANTRDGNNLSDKIGFSVLLITQSRNIDGDGSIFGSSNLVVSRVRRSVGLGAGNEGKSEGSSRATIRNGTSNVDTTTGPAVGNKETREVSGVARSNQRNVLLVSDHAGSLGSSGEYTSVSDEQSVAILVASGNSECRRLVPVSTKGERRKNDRIVVDDHVDGDDVITPNEDLKSVREGNAAGAGNGVTNGEAGGYLRASSGGSSSGQVGNKTIGRVNVVDGSEDQLSGQAQGNGDQASSPAVSPVGRQLV
jgi:hypothetical protein